MSSPAKLPRPLDPIAIGATWSQPLNLFEADKVTPLDLTGRAVTIFLNRIGLPEKAVEIAGVENAPGVVVFEKAPGETDDWPKGVYAVEIRMQDGADDLSLAVGEVTVAKGAGAQGEDRIGAARSPAALGIAIGGVAPIAIALSPQGLKGDQGDPGPNAAGLISFDDTLTLLGAATVQEALIALFEMSAGGQIVIDGSGAAVTFNNQPVVYGA
ncbi:hypothetical protein GCM10017620_24490 [Brevundimonas intermedia]|uniref:Uncharacterized protein n=1 Tax=Brevundimonas intermedia TaxID=74315 RepID=A0ABQ5TA48_9CAUL|nr:hypothetical protein [Brevundimonas intermedia]GLK49476.1 hypothetical protein GCM10017620_24490 [Brevundimonas intermedia]